MEVARIWWTRKNLWLIHITFWRDKGEWCWECAWLDWFTRARLCRSICVVWWSFRVSQVGGSRRYFGRYYTDCMEINLYLSVGSLIIVMIKNNSTFRSILNKPSVSHYSYFFYCLRLTLISMRRNCLPSNSLDPLCSSSLGVIIWAAE